MALSSILTRSMCRRKRISHPGSLWQRQGRKYSSGSYGIPLHHAWIGSGGGGEGSPLDHVVIFLHGLLGNGRNLRTMAKKACDASQQSGILVDVRGHGNSQLPTSQRSNFEACVQDLQVTFEEIPQITSNTNITLVGHSLGGRISLHYAYQQASQSSSTPTNINRVWLLDTVPGQANDSVERVVHAVTQLSSQGPICDRKQLLHQLTSGPYNIDQGTAQWLAASLQKNGQFGFDLTVVNDLLRDFHSQDFMGMLEAVTQNGIRVDLVMGGKNKGWSELTLTNLKQLQEQQPQQFGMHMLRNAGHWVHIDDLPGLLAVMDVSVQRKTN